MATKPISPTVLITAAHCVKGDANELGVLKSTKGIGTIETDAIKVMRNPKKQEDVFNSKVDLGLMMFAESPGLPIVQIRDKPAQVGDKITIVGFGADGGDIFTANASKHVGWNTLTTVGDALVFQRKDGPITGDGTDAVSTKGDSGGPMFIDEQLIGITSGGDDHSNFKESQYVNLHSEESKAFLRSAIEQGFKFDLPPSMK